MAGRSSELMIDSPTVLPTAEFFPDAYDRSPDSGRKMMHRVCGYMKVDPDEIDLVFFANKQKLTLVNQDGHAIGGVAGTYRRGESKFVVRFEESQLHDPMLLVGTMAHELAHVRLLGEERLDRDSFDNEILTDLTVVFHGMGIFLANHPRHWRSDLSIWPDTSIPKPEYMTTLMSGFAMAYRHWLREEVKAAWSGHLRSGIHAEFRQACRFLRQTQASQKKP